MAYVVLGWMGQPFMLPHFFKGLFLKLFIYYAQIVFGVLFKFKIVKFIEGKNPV